MVFVFDLVQQGFDAKAFFDRFIVIEAEFRDTPHVVKPLTQGTPHETRG
jgi:hypothetical protein